MRRPELIIGTGKWLPKNARLIYPVRITSGDRVLPAGEVEAIIQHAIMRYTKRGEKA